MSKEFTRIHEAYFFDFCLTLQDKLLDGWRVNESDPAGMFARSGVYTCVLSKETKEELDELKNVGHTNGSNTSVSNTAEEPLTEAVAKEDEPAKKQAGRPKSSK